ncbi:MAG: 16S rRNA (cytosine(1402)-N(4))-methyltransferase RsmH [Wenzhouxiangella sp.]|nr:MAG: 16S rRNA (cytosine(1402)-N(4))-methyltransferase RsmH [Wenzhouxiangella sp.]
MGARDEHVPVLLQPALTALNLADDSIVIDATYGRGGHSAAVLDHLGPHGRLFAVDQDLSAVEHAHRRFGADARVTVCHASFTELDRLAQEHDVYGQVSGLLMDLGVSSPQLDKPERGFTFREDGPLDMRMDTSRGESAAAWLARVDEDELTRVIRDYGEERYARRIARKIVASRVEQPITGTARLARVVADAAGPSPPERHPATRTFQAIRIHINDELAALERALAIGVDLLAPGGRFVVISFHSLEDRRVKQAWAALAKPPAASRRMPVARPFRPRLALIGKMQRPDALECSANPRARSARMRVAEKLAEVSP